MKSFVYYVRKNITFFLKVFIYNLKSPEVYRKYTIRKHIEMGLHLCSKRNILI